MTNAVNIYQFQKQARMKKAFPKIKKGVTFNGREIKLYNGVGVAKTPMDLNGVHITMDFKETEKGSVIFSFKTLDNTITITGMGVARMVGRKMNYPRAVYLTDMYITLANGVVKSPERLYWEVE